MGKRKKSQEPLKWHQNRCKGAFPIVSVRRAPHDCPHFSAVAPCVRRACMRVRISLEWRLRCASVVSVNASANACTRERAPLLTRRACECVRVRACRARVLSHGGEQHAAVSRPGVANHHRRCTLPFHPR